MLLKHRNQPKKIVMKPSLRLKRKAKPVTFDDVQAIVDVLRELYNTLEVQTYGQKLGLAAPQIGINKRIFIYKSKGTLKACINPWFVPSKAPEADFVESCYSLGKDKYYKVSRATTGWAHYYGINGLEMQEKLNGLDAVVFQHELSHLDGKCADDLGTKVDIKKEIPK